MFEMPIEKKEYTQSHIPLKGNIVPITHIISTYKRTSNSYKVMKKYIVNSTKYYL